MRKLCLQMASWSLAYLAAPAIGCAGSLPNFQAAQLQHDLAEIARQARPGILGVTVVDLRSDRSWGMNADRAYPMMSVFKAPLGAAVLSQVDSGAITLDQLVTIRRTDLPAAGVSHIAATFRGDMEFFSVRRLLEAAVSRSDNAAADALLELVGGPRVVTDFLHRHGIEGMRIDRSERQIAEEFQNAGNVPALLEHESPAQRDARLRQGYTAYLRDPRDRTTPGAAALFLRKLWQLQLLSPSSTQLLIELLYAQTTPARLRAGVPSGIRLADKCGTSYTLDGMTAAFNDIGVLTWPDGHAVIVAAFLTGSDASENQRNALFRQLAQTVINAHRHSRRRRTRMRVKT